MKESVEYRPLSKEEYERCREYFQYSFFPEEGSEFDDSSDGSLLQNDAVTPFGIFHDGALQTIVLESSVTARIRGSRFDVAVLSIIATPPEYRRRGSLSNGISKLLASQRERGYDFCIGRPFKHGFYAQFGAEMVCSKAKWTGKPRTLLSAVDDPAGRFRRLSPDDWAELDRVHRSFGEEYSLSFDRDELFWRELTCSPYDATFHIAGWERDGDLRGYVIYDIDQHDDGAVFRETDLAYRDREAFRHLLYYMGTHESQVDEVMFVTPVDTSVYTAIDGADLSCELRPGPIFRVTAVERALERLSYPADVSGSVVLEIRDETARWNEGIYALTIENGSATCTPTDETPAARTDVKALAQLIVGYKSVQEAERLGKITVTDDQMRPFLSAAFPSQAVFVRDEV